VNLFLVRDPKSRRWYCEVWDPGTGKTVHTTGLCLGPARAQASARRWISRKHPERRILEVAFCPLSLGLTLGELTDVERRTNHV
jgi:hypothetical protein